MTFDSVYGPLTCPCDTFTRWEDNLRAITLALEALRKVDRYGVTQRGEQYTGWKALPGPGQTTTTMSAADAAAFITNHTSGEFSANDLLTKPELLSAAYRFAAGRLHPDRGGSNAEFSKLGEARLEILRQMCETFAYTKPVR